MHASTGSTTLSHPAADNATLLDVSAVAFLLDRCKRHVHRLPDTGKMSRPLELGALVRWKRSELDCWQDEGPGPFFVSVSSDRFKRFSCIGSGDMIRWYGLTHDALTFDELATLFLLRGRKWNSSGSSRGAAS